MDTTPPMPCPLCSQRVHETLPFAYRFRGRDLHGVRCRSCSLTFVRPQPTREEISAMYDEEYFTASGADRGAHGPKAYMEMAREGRASRIEGAQNLDRRLLRSRPERGDFLEVGCGPGFLLREMARLGWTVSGIELSAYAVEYAREQLGLDVRQAAIETAEREPESTDAVFLGDVLEHLPDPVGSLRTIHGWLRPGGAVVIAVPSTMNLWSARIGLAAYRSLGRTRSIALPPYHLIEFVPKTLRATLEAAGFQVRELEVGAVPIRRMGLRGSRLENAGKVALQFAALTTSRLFNRWGDRIVALGTKS